MKSSYEDRAYKFAMETLVPMFKHCRGCQSFENAIERYNQTHARKLMYAHGVSRIVIIRADYVIKFDMVPSGRWRDGIAGNCMSEAAVYARAEREGMAHLLAKPSVHVVGKRVFSIMPRINHVGEWHSLHATLTDEEYDWLCDNVRDLHDDNMGWRRGKPIVIDYGWDAQK